MRPSLRTELVLKDEQRAHLLACRKKIRSALRAGLQAAAKVVTASEFYDPRYFAEAHRHGFDQRDLHPKFRTQGSWIYDTLNRPARHGQQIDLDDGMYVPMSIVEGHPAIASKTLYRLVDEILGELCLVEGWTLDTNKNICVRVVIDAETHVDVNIYAVPDAQFERVEKSMAAADSQLGTEFSVNTEVLRKLRLESDQIYVAHRQKGWEQSDPLQLEDWFNFAIDRHSRWTDVTRIVRYLKAWRDLKWQTSALSSLILMVCAVEALDEANTPPKPNRDDDGLLVVARALPGKLAGAVRNPVIQDITLNSGWDTTERNTYELAARVLRDELSGALEVETVATRVLVRIRKLFGERVPDDVSLISAVPALSAIRATPARETPSPKVGSSTSG